MADVFDMMDADRSQTGFDGPTVRKKKDPKPMHIELFTPLNTGDKDSPTSEVDYGSSQLKTHYSIRIKNGPIQKIIHKYQKLSLQELTMKDIAHHRCSVHRPAYRPFLLMIVAAIVLLFFHDHITTTADGQYLGLQEGFLNPDTLETPVTVATSLGPITGKTILLTDRAWSGLPQRPNLRKIFDTPRPYFNSDEKFFKNVSIFLGIPYARPPLKEHNLRFKLPQPVERWPTWPATTYRASCPQPVKYTGIDKGIAETNEDCLYLNVFTPSVRPRPINLYPVLIHIHGGKFDHGSGNIFPGHMLATSQEIVVVTFNYRLGVLGYMATGDNSSAGNYGLADQLAALQWVRDHIQAFNGDPQRITLWGSGSGAAAAGLLAITPRSRHIVKRVIAQSGSALADWAVQQSPLFVRNTSIVIGEQFGCYTKDTYSLMRCLESRAYNDFTTTEVEPEVGWLPYTHVLDSTTRDRDFALVPEMPEKLLETFFPNTNNNNNLQLIDVGSGASGGPNFGFAYMSGVTRDDGSVYLLEDEGAILRNYEVSPDFFERKLRNYVKIFNATQNQQAFLKAINFMYSPWSDRSNYSLYRQGLIDLYTDSWTLAGHDKMLKTLLRKGTIPTYAYVLNYTIEGLVQSENWMGVPYDTEYFMVSGAPFLDAKYFPSIFNLKDAQWTESDRNMSRFFMEAFGNFARGANPAPYAILNTMRWEPASYQDQRYLSINGTNNTSSMFRDFKQKSAQFWNEYIYTLLNREPYTWSVQYSPLEQEVRAYKTVAYTVGIISIVLLFIVLLCSCFYCRAKSEPNIDYMIVPNNNNNNVGLNTAHYSPPSTRVNSESSLKIPSNITYSRAKTEYAKPRNRQPVERTHEKHTLV